MRFYHAKHKRCAFDSFPVFLKKAIDYLSIDYKLVNISISLPFFFLCVTLTFASVCKENSCLQSYLKKLVYSCHQGYDKYYTSQNHAKNIDYQQSWIQFFEFWTFLQNFHTRAKMPSPKVGCCSSTWRNSSSAIWRDTLKVFIVQLVSLVLYGSL